MVEINIFLDEDDLYNNMPMYEYIIGYLIHNHISGATIFTAMGGFGSKRHLHFPRKFGAADEGPLLIVFVDDELKVAKVIPHLKEVVREGLITQKRVEII